MNTHQLLILIALILAIAGIIKPNWPCVAMAVLLICIDLYMHVKPI